MDSFDQSKNRGSCMFLILGTVIILNNAKFLCKQMLFILLEKNLCSCCLLSNTLKFSDVNIKTTSNT